MKKIRPRKRYVKGQMNGTEMAYAHILDAAKHDGNIVRWSFEPIVFKLAKGTTYNPDFMVVYKDRIEFHEVKGGLIRDDSLVKFKVAAELYPEFGWKMQQLKAKQWTTIREL